MNEQILQVGQAIGVCNAILRELPLSVEGEVASFTVSRERFVFFDLKDEAADARLSCFMMVHQLNMPLENGMRVVARGSASVYPKSGAFRLTVANVEPRGEGSLKRAFELLQRKLEGEGLFAAARKRPLPRFPLRVAVISSSGAAGFEDFMKIANSRLPGVRFQLLDVAVQGAEAEGQICQALDHANGFLSPDVIVLMRGGGSIEDLHAFNSEPVARAIARSKAPVLTGIGHERDVTIADLAADVRAATPSQAAQLLLPTREEVLGLVVQLMRTGDVRLAQAIAGQRQRAVGIAEGARQAARLRIETARHRVALALRAVEALSPQATLARGYTITLLEGKPCRSLPDPAPGRRLTSRFHDGDLESLTA